MSMHFNSTAITSGRTVWQYERRNGQVYCVGYRRGEDGEWSEIRAYEWDGVL